MQKLFKILKCMYDIFGMLKAAFGFGQSVEEKARQRETLNNSPAMQQGAVNVQEQKIDEKITDHAAKGNLDEVRKDDAE